MDNTKITKKRTKDTKERIEFDDLSRQVIGCALDVHNALGPGLLESTYTQCLAQDLKQAGIPVALEVPVKVEYKGLDINCGYRIDMLVGNTLIVELKSIERFQPVHEAQILTYMRLARVKTGLLINFNTKKLRDGIRRYVH